MTILYAQPTEDPWFSATTRVTDDNGAPVKTSLLGDMISEVYFSDFTGNVLGCATERLYCNPSLPSSASCIDSDGRLSNSTRSRKSDGISSLWPDPKEQSTFRSLLTTSSTAMELESKHLIPTLPTLLARNTLMKNTQIVLLPVDQWQIEQEYLFNSNLAQIQTTVVDHARGYWLGVGPFCRPGYACHRGCRSQVCSRPFLDYQAIC